MTLAVIVNGGAGVGKDAFVDFCIEALRGEGYTASKYSSVDQVKAAAQLLGWDGVKDEVGRQALSDLKDLSTRVWDGPMRYMMGVMDVVGHDVMFFHVREPREIARFYAQHPRTLSVLIERPGVEVFSNHADANVAQFTYTQTVQNVGSLGALRKKARAFVAGLPL